LRRRAVLSPLGYPGGKRRRLYQDATIPVALAHKYAAYPLPTAGQVLKLHAEEHLDRAA
jgi:hypothetical protein